MRKLFAILCVVVVGGCALPGAGAPTPQTPAETLAAAEITLQEQAKALSELVDDGILKGARAAIALVALETAERAIIVARAAVAAGDAPAAKLAAVTAAINELLRIVLAEQRRRNA